MPKPRIPTHPGALLREDILPAMKLSVTAAARALGVSRQMLHKILAEMAPVTPEMAVRLGALVGDGPEVWSRMQAAHDVAKARIALADEIKRIRALRAA
ncbi:MAG: HigA family addiction module antidote protein [Rhodospirillales bacterium]|nr:HigA family addiction module antidote protein [Rhodospirillales bacterium]